MWVVDDNGTEKAADETEAETTHGTIPPPPKRAGARGTARGPGSSAPGSCASSVTDRKLKGVAGGIASAADVDATLIRILFALAMLSGWGIVGYIIVAVVMKDETVEQPARTLPHDQKILLRIGLGVAAFITAGRLFDGWPFGGGNGGPSLGFILICIGAAVLWMRRGTHRSDGPGPDAVWPDPDPMTAYGDVPPPWSPPVSPPFGAGIDWRSTGRDLLRLVGAFAAVFAFLGLLAGGALVGSGAVHMRLPFLPGALGALGLLALVFAVVKRARVGGLLVSGFVLLVAAALALGLTSLPGGSGDKTFVVHAGSSWPRRTSTAPAA